MARYLIVYPDGYTRPERMGRLRALWHLLTLPRGYSIKRLRRVARVVKRADFK